MSDPVIVRSFHLWCVGWWDSAARVAEFRSTVANFGTNISITSAKVVAGEDRSGAAKPFRIAVDFCCPTVGDAVALKLIAGSPMTL
jgi:hypothetical protein